jgi:hypothetical protein
VSKIELVYSKARDLIRDGNILLWRPTSRTGRLIAKYTKAEYSHASVAGHSRDGRLRNVEMTQFLGSQSNPLSEAVKQNPGVIDVYWPVVTYNGHDALNQMLWICGQHYGWSNFYYIMYRRVFNWALPEPVNTDAVDVPRVCSTAVAWSLRTGGGLSPKKPLPDLLTTPGDLADPEYWDLKYQCTLVPD